MTERGSTRDFLLIPSADELDEAWAQYRSIVSRRAERGQVVEDGNTGHVEGNINAKKILEENPHLQEMIGSLASAMTVNIEEGRIKPDIVSERGAEFILEMFSIATTAYELRRIEDGLDE